MDQHTAEVANQVAEIVSRAGLTQAEIEVLFNHIRHNLTIGGYRTFEGK